MMKQQDRFSSITHHSTSWQTNPLNHPSDTHNNIQPIVIDPEQEQDKLVVESHQFVKMQLALDKEHFTAPGRITGILQLDNRCKQGTVRIKSITVDLIGFEQVRDKLADGDGKHRKHIFLKQTLVFHGPDTAPSEAVIPGDVADQNGYSHARFGQTVFQFEFLAPSGLPSSLQSKKGCQIHYEVVGNVWLRDLKAISLLKCHYETKVYENCQSLLHTWQPLVLKSSHHWGWLFRGRPIKVEACLLKNTAISGMDALVRVEIDNQSTKKISAVRLSLVKRIKTFRRLEDQKSEMIEFHKRVIQTAEFKNSKWLFDGRAVTLSLPIPAKEQSINAHLVQVSFTVCLRVCSMFCRDVVVEFPIQICHQSAISIETLASLQSTEEPSAPPPPPPMEAPPLPPVTQLPISSAADRILSLGESSSSLRREDRAEMHESANELNSRLQLEEKTIEKPETIIDKMFSRFDLENEKWTS